VDQQITREYRGQLLFELAEIKRVFNGVLGEINKQG